MVPVSSQQLQGINKELSSIGICRESTRNSYGKCLLFEAIFLTFTKYLWYTKRYALTNLNMDIFIRVFEKKCIHFYTFLPNCVCFFPTCVALLTLSILFSIMYAVCALNGGKSANVSETRIRKNHDFFYIPIKSCLIEKILLAKNKLIREIGPNAFERPSLRRKHIMVFK